MVSLPRISCLVVCSGHVFFAVAVKYSLSGRLLLGCQVFSVSLPSVSYLVVFATQAFLPSLPSISCPVVCASKVFLASLPRIACLAVSACQIFLSVAAKYFLSRRFRWPCIFGRRCQVFLVSSSSPAMYFGASLPSISCFVVFAGQIILASLPSVSFLSRRPRLLNISCLVAAKYFFFRGRLPSI